ncbi:ArsR/SmtB family transcription factor [Actinomycetospora straminea]|uniref:Metalloregulator ArsR/SmtB family transcription factor n=1 Tax=Actinomycetospora straminea TaxID=663607 RepID=A0ABP9DUR3_9PSEU|nr:metalloregulator ArsR/SmtB family transcription factor [Actinomycetospora straminea]MDD7932402.1 metalloregulator ArsR/SmtB family transcription factor [Actinomycetospora straminea]
MYATDNVDATRAFAHLPDPAHVEVAVEGLRMLADPTRLRMLWLLCGAELDVSTLADRLGATRPAISQHLAKLRLAGLVTQRRAGRHVLSRARDHHVGELLDVLVHDAGHRRAMSAHPAGGAP